MSLINDALNRAQAEAAEREAAERGHQPPEPMSASRGTSRRPKRLIVGLALLIVIALVVGRWRRPAPPPAADVAAAAKVAAIEAPADAPRETSPPPSTAAEETTVPAARSADRAREPVPLPEPERTGAQQAPPVAASPPVPAAQSPTATPSTETTAPATPTNGGGPAAAPPDAASVDTAPIDTAPTEATPEAPVSTPVAQLEDAGQPTTRWPASAEGQPEGQEETWYYVGRVALPGGGEIALEGIAWSETAPSAMLNGSLLRVGSEILGLRIVSIAPRTVTLAGQGQRIALQLASRAD